MVGDKTGQAVGRGALRTFCVSGMGTALEFYDFVIYGYAAALVFPQVFFPGMDKLVATLIAFAAFGTGFFARPVGGMVFGHFGDKYGRQKVLVATLLLMGASTFLIGCLPGYGSIGVAAPALLVVLRLIQGFAAGGEWGGAALFGIEQAPEGRRGLWGSFTSMGIGIGFLLGAGVFAIISEATNNQLADFAWRIPFWLGGLLVLVGMYARMRNLGQHGDSHAKAGKLPLLEVLRHHPRALLLSAGVAFGYITIAYIGSTFLVSYATQLGYSDAQSLVFDLINSATIIVSAPLCGHLSDKYGRKPVMIFGAVAMAAWFFAFFPLVQLKQWELTLFAYGMVGVLMGVTQGPIPAFLGEQFPRRVRYSGISSAYQLGAALGGGTASSIATAILILTNKSPLGVALYGAAALALLALCSYGLRETARLSLQDIDEQQPARPRATRPASA
ncbi:Predicted arabinose efflux permease, MFS family [Vogesella sp. LIG4]|nr:Predicted arabinose efflux permease, MFS family [Vogesella sp. LIG4]